MSADLAAVKGRYKALALTHHPDKVAAGEEKEAAGAIFCQIKEAYEVITKFLG